MKSMGNEREGKVSDGEGRSIMVAGEVNIGEGGLVSGE